MYLFHWHPTGLVVGKIIEQLSIYHSKQRCIILYQADHTTVRDNT